MFFRRTIKTNTNGLVGWWPFDNNTPQDFSGNPKVNGSLVASPVFTNGIAYSANPLNRRGILLNGSSQYVTCTADASLEWNTSVGATMMGWVFINSLVPAYSQPFGYCKGNTVLNQVLIKSTGKLAVYARNGDATFAFYDGTGLNTLVTGRLYHIAQTYINNSGTGVVTGFVNGVLDGTGSAAVTAGANSCTFVIGNDTTFAGRFFGGIVDDVRVYNRVLLRSEIFAIAQEPYVAGEVDMRVLPAPSVPPSVLYGHNIGANFTRKVTTIGY